jgi:enterochelin esterase-like enzyme
MRYFGAAVIALAMLPGIAALGAGVRHDFVIGPAYKPAPELTVHPGVPVGAVHDLVMHSADSTLYPGIARADNAVTRRRDAYGNKLAAPFAEESVAAPYTRHVYVYVPKQYVPGTPVPFLVAQDGHSYVRLLPKILDNMIAAHRLPVMVAVMIDSGGGDAQGSERGLEYDTVSGRYGDFVEQEVLPRVAKAYDIRFTGNPDGRATMGGSSGGAAAFTMAWFHPDLYHRVLTYSGTYVNQQSPVDPRTPQGAWDYPRLIMASARKPLRIWMEVGGRDLHYDDPASTYHNWVMANRRMAAALKRKGYQYRFVFAKGAHHVDSRMIAETLPGALAWLWRGYPVR